MFYVLDFSVLFCLEIPYLEVHLIIDVKLNYVDIFIEGMLFFHFVFIMMYKGQLISKCPFGFIFWTKLPTKLFLNFCPEIFCTFLGASWKLFGASCRLPCLWYYILSPQEAQRASMKPPGSYKKNLRAEIQK